MAQVSALTLDSNNDVGKILSGDTVSRSQLGSGNSSSASFLRGDSTWSSTLEELIDSNYTTADLSLLNEDRGLRFSKNGLKRWEIVSNFFIEGGSNSGSNFELRRYNDAGSLISTPLEITRGNGSIFLATSEAGASHVMGSTTSTLNLRGSVLNIEGLSGIDFTTDAGGTIPVNFAAPITAKLGSFLTDTGSQIFLYGSASAVGAQISFFGNGGGSPDKFIRALGGNLEIVNSAYTAVIASVSDLGVFFLVNASTVPSSNPPSGGYLYVSAGSLKFRGSSGTVTTLANA